MQAVAVGASIAYPLLRLGRAIPVPILMIGAGLFFAGSKTGQAATQKASDVAADVSGEAMRQAREFGDQVKESAAAATEYAADRFDRVTEAISDQADQVKGTADASDAAIASGSQRLKKSAASAGAALLDRAGSLKDNGVRLAGSARAAAGSVADSGVDAARSIRNRASEASDRAGKTIFQTFDQNPLLAAGVGLLIGGLIASALPRSDFEDDLIGDASSAAKRQAEAAAAKGFDVAKTTAGEVYDQTARQAEAEGLTNDGLGEAARDITQRVRRVAEAAVTTAFEPSEKDHQPNAHGDDHG
jgi:hypothetical protein